MADDASVQVKFGAQIDGLVAGINEAKSQLESITTPIQGIKDAFSGLAEIAVAGLGIDKIGDAVSKYGELGEQITRTSQILGISTDQVQQLSFAIRMGGGDAETASMTMGILEKNIAEAASGTGTAAQAFENMGIQVKDANGDTRSAIAILKDLADVMSRVTDANIRAEYGRALMGRGYQNLLPVLLQGKEGFEKLNSILGETGSKMSPEMVDKADDLAKHTKVLGAAWDGFAHTIESAVLPAYDALIQKTTSALEHTTAFITSLTITPPTTGGPSKGATGSWGGGSSGSFGPKNYGVQFGPQEPLTLDPLKQPGADSADKNQIAIEKSDLQTALELYRLDVAAKKDANDEKVASGQMSKQAEIADLTNLISQERDLVLQEITDERDLYDRNSADWEELNNKKLVVAKQYKNEIARLAAQGAQAQAEQIKKLQESYKGLFDIIDRGMDQMLSGVLAGTRTWASAVDKVFAGMAESLIEEIAKVALHWAAFEASSAVFEASDNITKALGSSVPSAIGGTQQNSALNAALTKVAAVLGINTAAHTAGTVATTGNTVATTVDTTATGTSTVATTAGTLATSVNTTTTASSGLLHVAALAENTFATVANTIATDLLKVAMFIKSLLPSFDVGSWSVPGDMVAMIHEGEMIIPAGPAAAIRSGGSLGSATTGVGNSGGPITININAIDTQTGTQFLKQNAATIAQAISGQVRNFNPALRMS